MKKPLIALALAGLLSSAAFAQPDDPLEAYRQARPTQRLAVRQMLATRYPNLPLETLEHLESRYPDLEVKVARAVLSLDEAYPGLCFSLPRHLVEDLGDEPARAWLDVKEAVLTRYPEFPSRMAELRRLHSPRLAVAERIQQKYPGFRTALLGHLRDRHPEALGALRSEARDVLRERHPGLLLDILHEVSSLVDESYPDLPEQLLKAQREGERPLLWLVRNKPDFLRAAAARIQKTHGAKIRSAAVDVLRRLEEKHARLPGQVGRSVLELVQTRYPGLGGEVWRARREARVALRQAVLAEFPELPSVVARTLEEKHPELLGKVHASVQRHYPELRQDFRAALERELPG
ncbi:MAG: hypothetical protein AB1758_16995, partial [Candidatus Eremiobacterota bacterium]